MPLTPLCVSLHAPDRDLALVVVVVVALILGLVNGPGVFPRTVSPPCVLVSIDSPFFRVDACMCGVISSRPSMSSRVQDMRGF